jgi:hypothetical protein
MGNTSTKLLVIAIIAAATTTSLSAAAPAFAEINCTANLCVGGTSQKKFLGCECPGGHGGREFFDPEDPLTTSVSGGGGGKLADGSGLIGGAGSHHACKSGDCTDQVGGSGFHVQGPGGNSGNAPPS